MRERQMAEDGEPEVGLYCDIACELGEGPIYDPAADTAWWFDIEGKSLFERPGGARETIVHPLPFMASALAVVDAERQLIAAQDGLYIRETATGRLSLHRPLEADDPVTRSNDARVHPSGAFWIGTMGIKAERQAGAIYWYRGGQIKKLYGNITIPNAICFSPDGQTAYFTDTTDKMMMRVAVDPATGLPTEEPSIFFDHRPSDAGGTHGSDGRGGLDGAVCDAEGVVWNARWGASSIDAYAPDGTRIRSIAIPTRQVTCPCFVGRNADRMIVTSAWTGMFGTLRRDDPQAGKTFILEGPFNGRHEPKVLL